MEQSALAQEVEQCLAELFAASGEEGSEESGLARFRKLREEADPAKVIACVQEQAIDPAFELHYLARAGYQEAAPALQDLTQSGKAEDVFYAAIGLAYLGADEGYRILEEFARGTHHLSKQILPWADVFEELRQMRSKKAQNLVRRMLSGEFGDVPKEYARFQ